jgi:hypothetical protein
MTIFQNIFWGYEITYPDFWLHKQSGDTDYFVMSTESLDPLYDGEDAGQIAIRCEWNWAQKDIKPLWNEHIGLVAGIIGAKNIGSAPWQIVDAIGLEAEIVLPKKDTRRLRTGILARGFCVLHFMVIHPKVVREQFEPAATKIISSLRFPGNFERVIISPEGLPIPPEYTMTDPASIINDIAEPEKWFAYDGLANIGALQSFYLRELIKQNWEISEYIPYTAASDLGFARYTIKKNQQTLILGLMPSVKDGDADSSPIHARIVYKQTGD